MIRNLANWFEHRTGLCRLMSLVLYERIPGGARWRYVWGSTLAFAFLVQLITGIALWAAYSPGTTTAWGSVYYIQHEMTGGWILRGVHHFMAQAMVVLLAIHLLQVVWDGAYRAPREVNFWIGLVLMFIVLALSLTGYLLPWDQKGYWATRVATNLVELTPAVGGEAQQLVVGGTGSYTHGTLSRFFTLHAGVLPAALVVFLVLHLALFRRHGICAKQPLKKPDAPFWPDQVLRDAVACLAVAAVVGGLTWYFRGAELTAPADGARNYSAARPEWYFLFLFQFLKLFHGETGEIIGAIVVPGLVMLLLFLMPLVARIKFGPAQAGHYFNVVLLLALFGGIAWLTVAAIRDDSEDRDLQNARWLAEHEAKVAVELAGEEGLGIPPEGAREMMRNRDKAVALRVFADDCMKCHNFAGPDGQGYHNANPTAPNLWSFGTRQWARGVIDPAHVDGPDYFGATALVDRSGGMVEFIQNNVEGGKSRPADADSPMYSSEALDTIAEALEREARRAPGEEIVVEPLIADASGCAQCHKYHNEDTYPMGPTLTGWGSRDWVVGMLRNPNGPSHYGFLSDFGELEKQQMPVYGAEFAPHSGGYSDAVLGHIADLIRGEFFETTDEE